MKSTPSPCWPKLWGIFVLKRNISARLAAAYHDIRAVLDSMAAWAYVIDENTHELLYLNEATRYFVPRARVGLKCYEALFRRARRTLRPLSHAGHEAT